MDSRQPPQISHQNPFRPLLFWAGALSVYACTHLLFLGSHPGFHYDEAWAANFALKIAQAPGFWPIEAMSPQTHAGHHYLVAAFMSLAGATVEAFRQAHIALGLIGVSLLGKALARQLGDWRLAPVFVLLAGLQPALITNHRFAIELTSFHVLCFGGMMSFGFKKRPFDLFLGAFFAALGISSHIFFVAPALALAATLLLENTTLTARCRQAIGAGALLSLPFVLKLLFRFNEKDKALALLAATCLSLGLVWLLPQLDFWQRHQARARLAVRLVATLTVPLVLFLIEGHWGMLAHTGSLRFPILAGLGLIPWLVLIRGHPSDSKPYQELQTFWCCLALMTLIVAPKPTGRYFETLFLASLALLAPAWIQASLKSKLTLAIWPVLLAMNLFIPQIQHQFIDREYRFAFFHDRSTDFLPKQRAALPLREQGCRSDQVEKPDPRIGESLDFILNPGDLHGPCRRKTFRASAEPFGLRISELSPSSLTEPHP